MFLAEKVNIQIFETDMVLLTFRIRVREEDWKEVYEHIFIPLKTAENLSDMLYQAISTYKETKK